MSYWQAGKNNKFTGYTRESRTRPEAKECRALIKWARLKKLPLFHIGNEGKRNPAIAKSIGIIKGVSDYFLPIPSQCMHGLFLELKAPGKKLTPEQELWLAYVQRYNYAADWTDNWEHATKIIDNYLGGVYPD